MEINRINKNIKFSALVERAAVQVLQPHGIHVRPSGLIAKLASSTTKDIFIKNELSDLADAHSIMSIMSLQARQGDRLRLVADTDCPNNLLAKIEKCISARSFEDCVKIAAGLM